MNNPLEKYGAALTEEGEITRGGKLLGAFCKRAKGRWQVRDSKGRLMFSGPELDRFVEQFWFWETKGE